MRRPGYGGEKGAEGGTTAYCEELRRNRTLIFPGASHHDRRSQERAT